MATHSIKTVQKIPASLKEIWDFFSSPANLDTITPDDMAFKTITKFDSGKIYPGQIIEYKVSPILKIPLYWMTEITEIEEQKYFIDEQRKGPYKIWHHEHYFKEIEGGVEMIDIVHYKNPLGFIGIIANSLFVKRQLKKIFEYRFQKVEEIFGRWQGQECVVEIN
jgi:ligand-binding SRPBCC domain-containing protein